MKVNLHRRWFWATMYAALFFGGYRMPFQSANRIILLLSLLILADVPVFSDCRCNPPKDGETTHWVGNMVMVFVEKRPYQTLRGKVVISADGKPLGGALVEVFTNPEYLLSDKSYSRGKPEQRRVAACRAGADGQFCFRGLASGKYELRSSSDDTYGWNASQIYVVVDRENGMSKYLRITMTLGI